MTTIKLYGGDLGPKTEIILVRCELANPSSMVEIDYCMGEGWQGTQFQCAKTRGKLSGLIAVAKKLASEAAEMPDDEFDCKYEEITEQ